MVVRHAVGWGFLAHRVVCQEQMSQTRMVVVAVKPFAYQDSPVAPGDVCVVTPVEASALVYQGQARWPLDTEGRGVYQRRDVLSEDETPAPRSRRSRRRDLVASA